MKKNIFPAIRLTIICLVFFVGIYTIIVLGVAQLAPNKGKGEMITANGKTYYQNMGQKFTEDRYFNSRPSAVAYNAAGSGGSNKGASNPDYLAEVKTRIDSFMAHNPTIAISEIPSDIVTASGSGLDPHISVQAALVQVNRIASIRGIAASNLKQLILTNTKKPLVGLLGTEKINVLELNIALDNLK